MPRLSRFMLAAAALMLTALFVLPIWRIDLLAPQYPEGLGMLIRINTVTGLNPTDLDNINNLNHYIGMKPITPEAIPELVFMPWIVGGLVVFGLVAAAAGARKLAIGWLASVVAFAVIGLIDFWRWGYDYGHDLDVEHAIIKVPGMAYQPPLIGTKQLLNFTAASWPDAGAIIAGIAVAIAVAALFIGRNEPRRVEAGRTSQRAALAGITAVLLSVALAACGGRVPKAIAYGEEGCGYCRMTISDPRFGGQVITTKGKITTFDSIECLASFYLQSRSGGDVHSVWVSDFREPGTWVAAEQAVFVRGGAHHSPMGLNLLAVKATPDSVAVRGELGGEPLRWADVLALVEREGERRGARPGDGGDEHR